MACARLLLSAVAWCTVRQSSERYLPGAQQQTRRTPINGTDRQTDGRTLDRFIDPTTHSLSLTHDTLSFLLCKSAAETVSTECWRAADAVSCHRRPERRPTAQLNTGHCRPPLTSVCHTHTHTHTHCAHVPAANPDMGRGSPLISCKYF